MNNVEKIKQEAQNLRDKLNDRVNENEFIAGEVFILNYFLSYIDLHIEPVSIDFEQELYKAFGQVKDFTLGMRIAKWFYYMGKNSQEPVSDELNEAAEEYKKQMSKVVKPSKRKETQHRTEESSVYDGPEGVWDNR